QNEINHFKPQTYYTMKLNAAGLTFHCTKPQSHPDKTVLESIKKAIDGQSGHIASISKTHKKAYPQQLYNLTDLQQDAYKRFHLGPKETLNTLQTLYERHKLVTYPRTDSNYLTDDMVDTLKDRLKAIMATSLKDMAKAQMSQTFSSKQRFVNNNKVSDHHAIIPTEVRPDINQLSQRESKIYMMIAQRYLENLMPPHEYEAIAIELKVGQHTFT
ncbi:DNA topoisomerase III, partial [Staphylococcus gallinarum]